MDIMATIIKGIIYPAVEVKNKSKVSRYLKEDEETQYLPTEAILDLQWRRLKELLTCSYSNCPYYRELFKKAGITPSDINSPSDYLRVPLLTKEDIQLNQEALLSSQAKAAGLIEDYTGGSTGRTLKFYYDEQRGQRRVASRIRHNRWSGWDIGQKMAVLWGASSDASSGHIRRKIKNIILDRTAFLDSFDIDAEKMEEYREVIERFKPVAVLAYANSIYLFAKFLKGQKHAIHPKSIICSAETLTDDKRKLIESVFGCKVFNRYGSREVGLLASECERHTGLHINAENVYVEILKDGMPARAGERGKVVITDLFNYQMPFIRYDIGDVAVATDERCTCGRGLPLIKSVEGRVSDFIITADGKVIHGEYFTHLFYGEDGVRQFQLNQESTDSLFLSVVPSKKYSEARILNIKRQIEKHLGPNIRVEINKVSEIPKTPSGKYRFTISKVPF